MRGTPFLLKGFTGGLNTISAPYELQPDETRECLNVTSTSRGSIRKRNGSLLFTPSPPGVELDSIFQANAGGNLWLLASGGGKLFSISNLGVVAEIGKGFTNGARWSFVQAPSSTAVKEQGPVYMVNGVDPPQYWTGTGEVKAWTGVASAPKLTDGVATAPSVYLKSETAGFLATDTGKLVKFETAVKSEGKEIKEAPIEAVISPKEVRLAIPEAGWEATVTSVHFTLERSYYAKEPHIPNGKYMIFAGNRIWMTGISEDPSAVWFSEFVDIGEGGAQADPSAWPTTNVVRFDGSDGQPVSGIGTVGPYILVFKQVKTWVIHNLNSGENRKLADTIGCVSHRSIVETNSGTFFLTADQGVYETNGSSLNELSYKVRPTILAANRKQIEHAAGAYLNSHYYLSYASGVSEVPNRTLDYDVQLKSWWLHDLAANQWTTWPPATSTFYLYGVPPGVQKGVVQAFVEGVYEDSGALYKGEKELSAFWISPWDPFAYYIFRHRIEAPFLKKRLREVFFDGEGQIIPFVYKNFANVGTQTPATVENNPEFSPEQPVNFGAGGQIFGNENEEQKFAGETLKGIQMLFGGVAEVGSARMYALGVGRAWSIGYGNKSNEPFEVFSYMMAVTFRKS